MAKGIRVWRMKLIKKYQPFPHHPITDPTKNWRRICLFSMCWLIRDRILIQILNTKVEITKVHSVPLAYQCLNPQPTVENHLYLERIRLPNVKYQKPQILKKNHSLWVIILLRLIVRRVNKMEMGVFSRRRGRRGARWSSSRSDSIYFLTLIPLSTFLYNQKINTMSQPS